MHLHVLLAMLAAALPCLASAQSGLRYSPAHVHVGGVTLKPFHDTVGNLRVTLSVHARPIDDKTSSVEKAQGPVWPDLRARQGSWRALAGLTRTNAARFSNAPITAPSPTHELDQRNQIKAPFLGIAWSSEEAGKAGWRWSGEIGAYASPVGKCRVLPDCLSNGVLPKPAGSEGMRWNSYLNLGVTYAY